MFYMKKVSFEQMIQSIHTSANPSEVQHSKSLKSISSFLACCRFQVVEDWHGKSLRAINSSLFEDFFKCLKAFKF